MQTPETKHLVFLSHSSRDGAVVRRIKDLLVHRTGGTVAFFCSSDNESIPFGRNWINKILSSLDQADLFFAFLSPNSLGSQWIFFEAGIAHQRDIPTVPVGIAGVDIGKAPPPLAILQGFNLMPDGLEKMMAVINSTFGFSLPTAFDDADYSSLRGETVETISLGDGTHRFQVFSIDDNGETPHERIAVQVQGTTMTVRSTQRTEAWESVGILDQNRYTGRFKYSRGGSPEDVGSHDFVWNGREFVGSAKLDSGRWYVDNLIWRPIRD
ncbi:MAG TPA: toll/interleukin-1 receptor domain-containing protein [Longimicrobium sp.]